MAGSRLEKFGTIYKRMQGLLRSGAIKHWDRPLWFDVYEAFPPRDPPEYQRPVPDRQVPQILYPEDIVRVQFYKTFGNPDVVDLTNEQVKTTCQRFVEKYLELLQSDSSEKNLFEMTTKALRDEGIRLRTAAEMQDNLPEKERSRIMTTSASAMPKKLSVSAIFGEDTVARAEEEEDFDVHDNFEGSSPKGS